METELVGPEKLEEALADWGRLEAQNPGLTPFNTADWGRVWLQSWDHAASPMILRVHDRGVVAGIVPLAIRRVRGLRILGMIGKEPGDYWDVVAAPENQAEVARAAGHELQRRARAWDLGILSCFPVESRALEGFAASGLRIHHRPAVRSPAIRLPSSFDEYLRTLPGSRRRNLRQHLNRLDQGDVTVREVRDTGEVSGVMSRWRELRVRQWRETGRQLNPSHAEDRFYGFMVQAASILLARGVTSLWEVSYGDRLAGVYLNFCDQRSFYWYLGGYEPELGRLGVGKIVIAATLRSSIEAGREWYDFTRGEDRYKYWYGAQDRLLDSLIVGHDRPRSRLVAAAAQMASRHRARGSGS